MNDTGKLHYLKDRLPGLIHKPFSEIRQDHFHLFIGSAHCDLTAPMIFYYIQPEDLPKLDTIRKTILIHEYPVSQGKLLK